MAGEKIFIVEDEKIVAEDLKRMLERLRYIVVGSAMSGDEALQKIELAKPDLVLMDIRIQGSLDGVAVAEHVVAEFDIPVIFLTAYADEHTVDRAKGTLPAAFILKPFSEEGLKTAIELALYRQKMDRILKSTEDWHGGILQELSVAVMATDNHGNITYMNKAAENLIGQTLHKILGQPLKNISMSNLDRKESPIKDLDGNVVGTALVLTTSPTVTVPSAPQSLPN